jgi:DNA-binding response OmpR family regulator
MSRDQKKRPTSTILTIEDEADIREVIRYNLEKEGYRVLTAGDGEEGLEMVRTENPDLVLLDLLLPGMDGVEVCRHLRYDPSTRNIPVIMVTAKSDESDVVLGLGVGADDYVAKPFRPHELVARVKAALRRGRTLEPSAKDEVLARGSLQIDFGRHEVRLEDERIRFTPTEFRLLAHLASRPGRVFSRSQLVSHITGEDSVITARSIDVHVRAIRHKLGRHRELVETVRGIGYRFSQDFD